MKIARQVFDHIFHNQRKTKVIDRVTQMQMAVEMLLHILLFNVLLLFLLFVDPLATAFSNYSLEEHQRAIQWVFEMNQGKWPLLIFVAFVLVLISVHFTHRISGPAFKITLMLSKYLNRDLRTPIVLRNHDYLKNIPPRMNEFLSMVSHDLHGFRKDIAELIREASELNNDSKKDRILNLAQRTSERINSYQINDSNDLDA